MATDKKYEIKNVRQTVYLDPSGTVVSGFELTVVILEFNETIRIDVPDSNPVTARKAIKAYIDDRSSLASLTD